MNMRTFKGYLPWIIPLFLLSVSWFAYWEPIFWLALILLVGVSLNALRLSHRTGNARTSNLLVSVLRKFQGIPEQHQRLSGALGAIIALVIGNVIIVGLHDHFSAHAQQIEQAAFGEQTRQAALVAAQQAARQVAVQEASHERRLAWQRAHPAEYAAQLATAMREAAIERAKQQREAIAQQRQQAEAQRQEEARARADRAAAQSTSRIPYHEFWNSVVGNIAMAYVSISYASSAEQAGQSDSAYRVLEYGKKFADDAKDASLNAPKGWDDEGTDLFSAASDLSDAIGSAESLLNTGRPGDAADTEDKAQSARDSVDQATDIARQSYVQMGGRSSDLESLPDMAHSAKAALDSLEQ